MVIKRHALDEPFAKDLFNRAFDGLPDYVKAVRRDPKNLDVLLGEALKALGAACVVEPGSAKAAESLKLASQAANALFQKPTPAHPVTVDFGAVDPVVLGSAPDPGSVTVYEWITAFYLNVLRQDNKAINELCAMESGPLRGSSTKNPEYRYLYMDAIKLFWRNEEGVSAKTISAVKATDPNRPDVGDQEWTLFLDVPQIRVFIYMAERQQPDFSDAMRDALKSYKEYWGSKKQKRSRNYRGYVSVGLSALAALAKERGLTVDVESPYLVDL